MQGPDNSVSNSPVPSGVHPVPRWMWVLVATSPACNVGMIAEVVAYAGGINIWNAILTGGAAFAGAVALLLNFISFIAGRERQRSV